MPFLRRCFSASALQGLGPGKKRSRSEDGADMMEDLREFDKTLQSHRFPNLKTRMRVFGDENHPSVFPLVLTHGLRAYLRSSK
jgi:hypothetical protein